MEKPPRNLCSRRLLHKALHKAGADPNGLIDGY